MVNTMNKEENFELDNSKDAQPLYLQIKDYILRQINENKYKEGDILPSELEFQKQFKVSRITVRNAINELVVDELVQRARGKGTVVLPKKVTENISHTSSFSEELASRGLVAYTSSVKVSNVRAGSYVAEHLGIEPDDFVVNIQRIRGTKEYPIVYADSYFTLDRNLPVDKDLYYNSLYETIKKYCGIDWKTEILRHSDSFESILADDNLAEKLQIKPGMPVLKRVSRTKDKNGRIFEFAICYYRGDKFVCSVEF